VLALRFTPLFSVSQLIATRGAVKSVKSSDPPGSWPLWPETSLPFRPAWRLLKDRSLVTVCPGFPIVRAPARLLGLVSDVWYTSGVKPGLFVDLCRATGSWRNEATCQHPKLEEYKREPGIKSIKVRSFSWCSPLFQEIRGFRDPEVISRRSNCVSARCLHGLNRCISTTMSRVETLTAPSERAHLN
jgi:hypothetical protein